MSDLIERNEAIDALFNWYDDMYDDRDAIDVICKLPSAEPKVGKWIIGEEPKEGLPRRWRVMCSNCGKALRIVDRKLWDYCPRCGAKMEENR